MLHDPVGIVEAFVEVQERFYDPGFDSFVADLSVHCVDTAWANGKTHRTRMQIRCERAAHRPPCPHCGGIVERVGATAKIPKYCTPRCTRAARFARWWTKNRDKRNRARRKTNRASPNACHGTKGEK